MTSQAPGGPNCTLATTTTLTMVTATSCIMVMITRPPSRTTNKETGLAVDMKTTLTATRGQACSGAETVDTVDTVQTVITVTRGLTVTRTSLTTSTK